MKIRSAKATLWVQEYTRERKQGWEKLKHRRFLVIAMIAIIVLLVTIVVYLVVVPIVSRIVIIRLAELRNGSTRLENWLHVPVPLIASIYLWNLTNSDDVAMGRSVPIFNQVGPYVYEKYRQKIPTAFKEDSIVYNVRDSYTFREDLTAPLTLDDTVITLHAGIYGMAKFVESIAPSLVPMMNKGVPYLFPGADSIFIPVRVGSFLFDGLLLNCSGMKGNIAEMMCKSLPNYAPPTLRRKENTSNYVYSFLAHKNGTLLGPYEEMRGSTEISQVGTLLSYHNYSQLGVWQTGSRCDKLRGTDTYTFAPFIQTTDTLEMFISDVCQVVPLYFLKEDSLHGLAVYKFRLSDRWLDSVDRNPDNECLCMKGNDQFCHNTGVRDVSPCMKAPIVISLPHFTLADEEFRNYAQGMSPNQEQHSSILYIEPQTGTPIKGIKQVQFNMYLKRMKGFNLVKNVSEGLFPLLWMKESISLTADMLTPVKLPLTIQWAVNTLCLLLVGISLVAFCLALMAFFYFSRLCCFRHVNNNQVTPISATISQTKADILSTDVLNQAETTH